MYFIFSVCPPNRYLAYNGSDSVCMDVMSPADCSDMLAGCHSIYGVDSILLRISSYGVLWDAIEALKMWVYMDVSC